MLTNFLCCARTCRTIFVSLNKFVHVHDTFLKGLSPEGSLTRRTAVEIMEKKKNKISRGYRLEASTHSMIKSLEQITRQNTDAVISKSCALYYKEIFEEHENLKNYSKTKSNEN